MRGIDFYFESIEHLIDRMMSNAECNRDTIVIAKPWLIKDLFETIMSGYIIDVDQIEFDKSEECIFGLHLTENYILSIYKLKNRDDGYHFCEADDTWFDIDCNLSYMNFLNDMQCDYRVISVDETKDFEYIHDCDVCEDCDECCAEVGFEIEPEIAIEMDDSSAPLIIENMYGNIIYGDNIVTYNED